MTSTPREVKTQKKSDFVLDQQNEIHMGGLVQDYGISSALTM